MIIKMDKNQDRLKRHKRVRKNISGTTECPRLCVYRSLNHIYAQIIDDTTSSTLVAASTMEAAIAKAVAGKSKKEAAKIVGKKLADKAFGRGIETVVFDRGGYVYMGRVAALADGAREAGLKF